MMPGFVVTFFLSPMAFPFPTAFALALALASALALAFAFRHGSLPCMALRTRLPAGPSLRNLVPGALLELVVLTMAPPS